MTDPIVMDESKPDNGSTRTNGLGDDLVALLREFLEMELRELRREQANRELEVEEDRMHEEQYGEDASMACFDFFFALDWS